MKSDFNSIENVLDFAIKNEQEAYDFYINLAKKSKNEYMKYTFKDFAKEEKKHKSLLKKIKNKELIVISEEDIADLKLADFLVFHKKDKAITYEEALVLAMKREKAAYRLYKFLADKTEDKKLRKTFNMLANEEAKHKLRFEIEYDELVMREN